MKIENTGIRVEKDYDDNSKTDKYCVTMSVGDISSFDEAYALVLRLRNATFASDPLASARQPDTTRPVPVPVKEDPLTDAEADEVVRETMSVRKAKAKKPEPAPTPVVEDLEEEDESKEEEDDEQDEDPIKVKVTKELKNATKLREVVELLIAQGINTKKGLVRACTSLTNTIPVLGKISDIESRVATLTKYIDPSIS